MRKTLFAFLMIVMLTPSLVCAMPICTDEALAAKAQMPCADHADHQGDKKEGKSDKLTFMSDCAGVDMQKANAANFEKPDLKSGSLLFLLLDNLALDNLSHADAGSIRGPPPDWPGLSQTQPTILLTTQRLRI
ncbi:MAG: hypothetical protein L6Q57_08195 [Alphaproteobacteria bacterium]|nr:hypothetical protein [Alphaproteobacteria bacterium]